MTVKFTKNNGERLDAGGCYRDFNLLAHAQMIELDIGSECGGHGRCGKDRVILAESQSRLVNAPTAIELHHLTQEELEMGMRLACQCFPNQNELQLDVRFGC